MTTRPVTLAISGLIRPMLESRLPEGLDVRWFMTHEQALDAKLPTMLAGVDLGSRVRWFIDEGRGQQA